MQRSLFRKYLIWLCGTISLLLIVVALVQGLVTAYAQRQHADALFASESRMAQARIASFLQHMIASMSWVSDFDQPGVEINHAMLREEAQRLLRKEPAIKLLRYSDNHGCILLEVARVLPDQNGSCDGRMISPGELALSTVAHRDAVAYGEAKFIDGSEPDMTLALAARGARTGTLFANVDLRQIHATIDAVKLGSTGNAFVIDHAGQLIAHPDQSLVLRHLNVAQVPVVFDALDAQQTHRAVLTRNWNGEMVLAMATTIPGPGWYLIIQQPIREAFAPVFTLIQSMLLIMVLALILSVVLSIVLAKRLSMPIQKLRIGAELIGGGALDTRIDIHTGDEIELLATTFNRMAATLSDSYRELEFKVQQRTSALAEAGEKLQQQADQLSAVNAEIVLRLAELAERKEQADRANAAKTRFITTASHDLMQPMHAVGLLVGMLRQTQDAQQIAELAAKIEQAVVGLESMFSSLLDISKLESQVVKIDIRSIDLGQLMQLVATQYRPLAEQKNLSLRVVRCRVFVNSDPVILGRIIGNLLNNAIRYTNSGKVLLGCRRIGDTMVRLQVCDTGVGIATQHQSQVFDEFFQIRSMGRESQPGLGLGLSIVKQSADLLGHRLFLQSQVGRGSLFGIELPRVVSLAKTSTIIKTDDADQTRLGEAFVVLVDDDPQGRHAMGELFKSWGCHVLMADSVADLQAQLEHHLRDPDLIITDLELDAGNGANDGEGRSGLDAIALLRRRTEIATPALIITGSPLTLLQATLPVNCIAARKPIGAGRIRELCIELLAMQLSLI